MKTLLNIFILLAFSSCLNAAKPVIEVPALPFGENREYYEDSEELFAMKLLEYYRASIWLESQLIVYGEQLKREVPLPSFDELSDGEFYTIEKYYKIAKALESKIKALPEVPVTQQLFELRERLIESENSRIILDHENYKLNLENMHKKFYEENMMELINQVDSLKFLSDSLIYENQKMISYSDFFQSKYFLSVAGTGNYFIFRDDRVSPDMSIGIRANVHASQILGYGPYLDFWFAYIAPQINTLSNLGSEIPTVNYEWITHLYSAGITGTIPKLVEFSDFEAALKIGFGFYWGDSRIPNVSNPGNKWDGSNLYFELNTSKSGRGFPVELFVAYNLYFQSNKMNFNMPDEFFVLNNNFDNFSFGLRFKFWGN